MSKEEKGIINEEHVEGGSTSESRNPNDTYQQGPSSSLATDETCSNNRQCDDEVDALEPHPVVDGGIAWLVAIGTTSAFFFAGLPLSWGVIQDTYLKNQVFSEPNLTILLTLVGSLNQGCMYIFIPATNMLYVSWGPRKLTIIGSILIFLGLMLTAEANAIWQMLLSLGVCTGLGVSIMYGVALRCLPQWFVKKRATAFGIQASCNPFAGLILPFIIIPVNNTLGHKCTVADRIGPLNMYLVSMSVSVIAVFAIWMFAYSFATLLGFIIVYGLFCGQWPVVNPSVTVSIVGMDRYPSATNFIMLLMAFDIVLPVIASIVGTSVRIGGNDAFIIYKIIGGGINGICALIAIALKFRMGRSWMAKV
ncbi:hypothetical protein BDB00DRAFT_942702 [Zychaea mexicana]|uniref:uncharacterized protein n=1 Tax=Zychaea mexicana TaxID=64656 RepID=UPI0022FE0AD8|nr:uncharacterized protein BDB00DRAFT_942702 [Zychaea mexicana]KAI9485099.1 hypothetical protein BDB00DRAFT_942702 [Zychaea mexicana]